MIPHRMLGIELSGSGLKERVTACRKRLRVSRVTHKPHALNEAIKLFPGAAPARMDCQGELEPNGTLLLPEEPEVGLT